MQCFTRRLPACGWCPPIVATVGDAKRNQRVCGVDGCPGGWVVADTAGCRVVPQLSTIAADYDLVGIDMPIGLSADGRRQCDSDARKALFHRASTVFSAPPRPLLHLSDYALANAESRRRFGRGISKQSFMIWPKIRELDVLAQAHPGRFIEVHPECSFAQMAGEPLPSKHSEAGKNSRKKFLENFLGNVPAAPRGARIDDVLDAHAVLWSTLRFVRNEHASYGDEALDAVGLTMRIVA